MYGLWRSFPDCIAKLKIRFSVASSRLISAFETGRSRRLSPLPVTMVTFCRSVMKLRTSAVVILVSLRPPKNGFRCLATRRTASSSDFLPLMV